MNFDVERLHSEPSVTLVTMKPDALGWEQWFLLRADVHHDNQHCNQALELAHLEEAKERGAGILDFGDLFCAMQGKWDKRADQNQLRVEHRGTNYFDKLVDTAVEFYRPYRENWVHLSPGNHEDSVMDHHHTDLTQRLADNMRVNGLGPVVGTYRGWVVFKFEYQSTHRQSTSLHYTHGYGGGGPVTRDTIQATNRQMVYTDADILVSGHTHDAWNVPVRRERLLNNYRPESRDVEVIKCGGYKDEFTAGKGYSARKGHSPKPIGAYWLRFRFSKVVTEGRRPIVFDCIRAKEH